MSEQILSVSINTIICIYSIGFYIYKDRMSKYIYLMLFPIYPFVVCLDTEKCMLKNTVFK